MKKITIIPETLAELPRKEDREELIQLSIKMRKSLTKKLREKSLETGYPQQHILEMALEAFLK